ncbi:MAG: RNA polymerase sigma factor [Actinobacteria bacterium]|nr:RNA polymerase sigma factor [Actinomycetota bacterium]
MRYEAVDDFTEVYRTYVGRIYRYCLMRTNSRQDAEDVTAEVFARYLEKGVRSHQSIAPWLFKVAGNLCIDRRRQMARLKPLEDETPAISPETSPPWQNQEAWRALSDLKTGEQQVIFLKAIEDMSFKEVAAFLGKRENSIKALFYRGIGKLKSVLKEGDPDGHELRIQEPTRA